MKRRRLTERFQLGDHVSIYFKRIDLWVDGVVIKQQKPAVWVRTADGRDWFVTNGSRIQHATHHYREPEPETPHEPERESPAA